MTSVATRAAGAREGTIADRFLAAVPLLSIFFWLGVLYSWEAWRHRTPWLFGDELELTQLSRSIADTGHAARRGAFGLAACFLAWSGARWTRWRRAWSRSDWIGFVVLVIGAAIAVSGLIGHHYTEWLIVTRIYKHRMFTLGLRAAGAFTIGLG